MPASTPIAVAIVEYEGRYLAGPRPPNVPLAGLWEFPGGKIQAEESPGDAAVRECTEETGLAVRVESSFAVLDHVYEHGTVRLHFFTCVPVDPDQPPREPFCWIDRHQLAEYSFPAANQPILRRLLDSSC